MNHTLRLVRNLSIAVLTVLSASSVRMAAAQETVIYNFGTGGATDGANPYEGLIADGQGNLFGTTLAGGINGQGSVFELSPVAGGGWSEKVLYRFTGGSPNGDGAYPRGALVFDSKGNLYGSTLGGGTTASGTVYELSPSAGGTWTETVLYSFGSQDNDGFLAVGNLVLDAQGNLYGITVYGGANSAADYGLGGGTLFELTHSAGNSWTEQVLYSFGATATDGLNPRGGLAIDAAGHVYGTTSLGGSYSDLSTYGGTVFEATPGSNGSSTLKILHEFNPATGDGSFPMASVILGSNGHLYGTTVMGGNTNAGTVFELAPVPGNGPWTENLFKFTAKNASGTSASGYGSTAGLTLDPAGNVYGTTVSGGAGGAGTAFELTPAAGTWTETVLHSFPATTDDGQSPHGGLVIDSNGSLYGTTTAGGTQGKGTVFELAVAAKTKTSLALSTPAGLVAGKPITLTATVVAMGGTGTPTGTVTFAAPSGGSVTVPLDSTGKAVYNGVIPPAGMYSVFSRYNGASGLAGSVSSTFSAAVSAH